MIRGDKRLVHDRTSASPSPVQPVGMFCTVETGENNRYGENKKPPNTQTGSGMRAWTTKATGLTSCFVHVLILLHFHRKTWRRNKTEESHSCVFNQSAFCNTQPHLSGLPGMEKARPRVGQVTSWAHFSGSDQRISNLALQVLYSRWTKGSYTHSLHTLPGQISQSDFVFHGLEPCFPLSDSFV